MNASGPEPSTFEEMTLAYQGRLRALVESRLGPRLRQTIEVDDIVQETFCRALRAIDGYRPAGEDSFFRWMGGIANHVIQEAARREKRELIVPLDDGVPSDGTPPGKGIERDERFERLRGSLDSLSPEHRRVIVLARIERLPMKEVARRMERSPEAVTQLLWRALRRLKEAFGTTDSFGLPPRSLKEEGGRREGD